MTTAEYVTKNWQYFERSWRSVNAAIQHYKQNPGDLENEVVGVNSFKERQHVQERDSSSTRISSSPTPNRGFNDIINRIYELNNLGVDTDTIQLQIGPVPELSGIDGDLLSLTSISTICQTAKPIFSSWGLGAPDNHTRQPDKTLP